LNANGQENHFLVNHLTSSHGTSPWDSQFHDHAFHPFRDAEAQVSLGVCVPHSPWVRAKTVRTCRLVLADNPFRDHIRTPTLYTSGFETCNGDLLTHSLSSDRTSLSVFPFVLYKGCEVEHVRARFRRLLQKGCGFLTDC